MSQIELQQGDITKIEVDAIVNAANNGLRGGGGVDGAIHRAGGPSILEECIKIGYCATGDAVITTAGSLPAKHVIHTVGPVWHGGDREENQLLTNAYSNSLKLAAKHHLRSVSFPNISTGIYGYPKDRAAAIAIRAVKDTLQSLSSQIKVVFVCFDDENFKIYREKLL